MAVEQLEDRLTPSVNSLFSFGAPLTSVGQQIGTALVPVLRSDTSGTASVAMSALDDSALNGVDYNFTNQTLNFADGQSEVDVSVGIVETGVWQTSQFELSLSSPSSGYGIDSTLGSTTVQILPVTWSAPADITYGAALSATELNPTAEVAGSWSFSPAAGTVLNAGASQTLSTTFTPSDNTLDPITVSTAINVLHATPTITWTPTNITYGTDLGSNADASADVGGSFSYSFDTSDILNAGTHQALSVTFTPSDSTDYTTASQTIYIDVGQANAWISGIGASDKTYDATTAATLTGLSSAELHGIRAGDDVNLDTSAATGSFADAAAADSVTVSISGLALTGAQAGNYHLDSVSANADITPATLTLGGISGTDKVYDGTTTDAITGTPTLVGIFGTDDVTLDSSSATASFTDMNAGTDITVIFSGFTLGGADASNYTLAPGSSSADITPIALTVAADPQSVVYGDTAPTLTYQLTSGALLPGDSFSGALTSDAGNAGATLSHDNGIDAGSFAITQGTLTAGGNYAITFVGDSLAVTPKALTISSGVSADSKTYDDGTIATLNFNSPRLSGTVGSDQVSDDTSSDYTAAFDTADTGAAKPVTVSGLGLTGAQAGDYTLTQPSLTADISKADATITVTPYSLTYDGNAHTAGATATGVNGETLSGLDVSGTTHTGAGTYNGDAWTFTDTTGNYNNASGTVNGGIARATPTILVTVDGGVYTSSAYAATATVAGVVAGVDDTAGSSLEDVGLTFTYYAGATPTGTPLAGAPSAAGVYTAVANFAGSTNYSSGSASQAFTISPASSSVTLASDNDSSVYGTAVTLTATVSAVASGIGTPAGAVYFYATDGNDNTFDLGTVDLDSNGTAQTTANLPGGLYTLHASYSPNPANFSSSSATAQQYVDNPPVASATTITLDQDTAITLQPSALFTDADNDALTLAITSAPLFGDSVLNNNGTLTYTPYPGYNGADSFSVSANDGQATTNSTIQITVQPLVYLASSEFGIEEGGTATITVNLSGPAAQAVTVQYATSDGTAKAGTDYTGVQGTLTIPAGQTSASFTVQLLTDDDTEAADKFAITLSNPTNAGLGTPAVANFAIYVTATADDDPVDVLNGLSDGIDNLLANLRDPGEDDDPSTLVFGQIITTLAEMNTALTGMTNALDFIKNNCKIHI